MNRPLLSHAAALNGVSCCYRAFAFVAFVRAAIKVMAPGGSFHQCSKVVKLLLLRAAGASPVAAMHLTPCSKSCALQQDSEEHSSTAHLIVYSISLLFCIFES